MDKIRVLFRMVIVGVFVMVARPLWADTVQIDGQCGQGGTAAFGPEQGRNNYAIHLKNTGTCAMNADVTFGPHHDVAMVQLAPGAGTAVREYEKLQSITFGCAQQGTSCQLTLTYQSIK